MIKGLVTKGVTSRYIVETAEGSNNCYARGRLKKEGEIRVGDFVEVDKEGNDYVISKVLPRKNALIRPYVANVDICFIVIAPVPAPDFILVDKIIINALANKITPVLVLNKEDLTDCTFKDMVLTDYTGVVDILVTCAKTGEGIDRLLDAAANKTACLAGQSAVGKSSLLNAILGGDILKTGGLSAKIDRGTHTTRQSEIITVGNARIIDTCGFSMLELPLDFNPAELVSYYDEYSEYALHCKFRTGCTHISEPDCTVKQAVNEGRLSKNRYDRYVALYEELKEKWRKRYE